jgi:hypothetical protein
LRFTRELNWVEIHVVLFLTSEIEDADWSSGREHVLDSGQFHVKVLLDRHLAALVAEGGC